MFTKHLRLVPVQAREVTEGRHTSSCEVARIVAARVGWLVDAERGTVHQADGTVVADGFEDLAEMLAQLGAMRFVPAGVHWEPLRVHEGGAALARRLPDVSPTHRRTSR